ncbi:hypothetical protein F4806DRAFT_455761 [Annulohypoxylon nitens]|nr:hypothetical protein F4806DRAFT_455761 [Annulohypoxylon nitens]
MVSLKSFFKRLLRIFRLRRKALPLSTVAEGNNNNNESFLTNPNQLSVSTRPSSSGNVIYGLRELHVPDNAVVDIIFLHGLTGRADTTFIHEGTGTFWPRDLLPKDIENARILTFGYDADVVHLFKPAGRNSLSNHARNLLNDLVAKRYDTASQGSRKIIFVAHSLGGLVVKRAMALSENLNDPDLNQIEKHTVGILFLGTPHRGSDLAPLAKALSNIVQASGKGIINVLEKDSAVLADLEDSFTQWYDRNRARCELCCFFEELESRGIGIVVKPESAIIAGRPHGSIHASHSGMVKFPDSGDAGYMRVCGFLKRWVQHRGMDKENSIVALHIHMDNIGLAQKGDLDAFTIPKEANEICLLPTMKQTVEWFIQSLEFQTWVKGKHHALLWLHGSAGMGKTTIMSRVMSDLPRQLEYAQKWDLATISCSKIQSENAILASLIDQLVSKNKRRAHSTDTILESLEDPVSEADLPSHLWRLLEAVVKGASGCETIFLLDDIDRLENDALPTFIKRLLELEKNATTSGAMIRVLVSSRSLPNLPETLAYFQYMGPDKERLECLESLKFEEWNAREALIEEVSEGGSWILSHREYIKWMRNSGTGILWIEGKPGSGKSTLSKRIVKMLRNEHTSHKMASINAQSNQDTIIAAFYYSFRGGVKQGSHELMLRSIVYQIWKENSRLFSLLRDAYRELKSNDANGLREGSCWTYDRLKTVLLSLHNVNFPLSVSIVVDGMDESDSAHRENLLNFLINLPVNSSKCSIKVLIASRPENDIHSRLHRSNHIILQEENAGDVRRFVERSFKSLEDYIVRPDDRKAMSSSEIGKYSNKYHEIENYIINNSQGVFLWVSLVFKELRDLVKRGDYTMDSLQEEAQKLPKELGGPDGFYRTIVQTVLNRQNENSRLDKDKKEKERERSRIILTWLTFPKRPISMDELKDVLVTPFPSKDVNFSCYSLEQHRPLGIDRALGTYCGSLIEIRGYTVQLIHQTVREFLLDRDHVAKPYDLDQIEGDKLIFLICCANIRVTFSARSFRTDVDDEFSEIDSITEDLGKNNLLHYSLSYLTTHLEHLGQNGFDLRQEFMSFISDIMSTPLCYSVLLLSRWIVPHWLPQQSTGAIDSKFKGCLQSAFVCSAMKGRGQALKILLLLKADINTQDKQYHCNALQAASYQGHLEIVQILVSIYEGADVNVGGRVYGTALQAASYQGYLEIVQFLVQAGADINARGGKYGSAMEAATSQRHSNIVEYLLSTGG